MATLGLIFSPLVFMTLLAMCLAEEGHWPDFSCHPRKSSVPQETIVNHHRMGWRSCQYSYKKNKGNCDKICVLWNREILVRENKEDPFVFDVKGFLTIFAEELGIKMETPDESEKKRMDKVRAQIEECIKKYPEFATVPVKKAPCEPYLNLFQCIDLAVKC